MTDSVSAQSQSDEAVTIGTKTFTESVILGEILKQSIESDGHQTALYKQLGGTRILWNALVDAEIDLYPDYTGTIIEEILSGREIENRDQLIDVLDQFGIEMTEPLGFNNTYALGMNRERAEELGIETISDLRDHPELIFGFSNEFMDREDGWIGVQQVYQLTPQRVRGLDHDLAYRGLDAGNIDVIDLYSTDAEIDYYDLKVLEDDLNFFPDYEAVFLYRSDLNEEVVQAITRFEGEISREEMIGMNAAVKLDQKDDALVASEFLAETSQIESRVSVEGFWDRLWRHTLDHLYLVGISLGLAILLAIPVGVLAVKVQILETAVLGAVGILQTIPSLALLVFMIPLFGIGALPAIAALFLYSLLPIVRNTHAGIKTISEPVKESARALGLPNSLILRKIELPIAVPSILAGIKTSAVINVGTATLGALIGAGGYGQPILTGIRLDSVPLILEGAVPAAVLALLVQGLFDLVERWLVR
ncbi:MAG: glycine betaine ABC transporter substrate-binding protein [Balneolaceae bacterium]|nr:glycine betaine ABC transporter substrate-binding protein [Balneolaceae bacterium]